MKRTEDVNATECTRGIPEYAQARSLLAEKKELQARLSEINSSLRKLQTLASAAVDLAKADLKNEAPGKFPSTQLSEEGFARFLNGDGLTNSE